MYPLRLPYQKLRSRLKRLLADGYAAEALVTSMFTAERLLRRTLIQLVISAGFTNGRAFQVVSRFNGIAAVKDAWSLYDRHGRGLVEVIGNANWKVLQGAAKMRNEMVHGSVTYSQKKCKSRAIEVISVIDAMKDKLHKAYGYHGWGGLKKRIVSALHTDPKVTM